MSQEDIKGKTFIRENDGFFSATSKISQKQNILMNTC